MNIKQKIAEMTDDELRHTLISKIRGRVHPMDNGIMDALFQMIVDECPFDLLVDEARSRDLIGKR